MTRINFQPYTRDQLIEIVDARLSGLGEVMEPDAIRFAAAKVSSVSGDARRALDICRSVPPSIPRLIKETAS